MAISMLMMAALNNTVVGQNNNTVVRQSNEKFATQHEFNDFERASKIEELRRLTNYNDNQQKNSAKQPKVVIVPGAFGDKEKVYIGGKEGEHEEIIKYVNENSDGNVLGIGLKFSENAENAETSEEAAAYSSDAFHNNDGDLRIDSRLVDLSRDEKIELQRLKVQYENRKLVRDKDFIVDRNGERVIVSEYGYKVSLAQLVSQTEFYNSKRVARERADEETKKSAEAEFENAQTDLLNTLRTLQISAAKDEDKNAFKNYSTMGGDGDELRLNYKAILDALNCNGDCGHVEQ